MRPRVPARTVSAHTVVAMFPVGGVGVMLALITGAFVVLALAAWLVSRWAGLPWSLLAALLAWTLVVIGTITLIPANGAPGIVSAEGRLAGCSWDIGGPAPDGFWILPGGQRLLNTVVFAPSGLLLAPVLARFRFAWLSVPLGLVLLAGYSVLIELTQLVAARIDRACDVTDVVDNVTGAVLGCAVGVLLVLLFRPWRSTVAR
jgi:hypothetical protein